MLAGLLLLVLFITMLLTSLLYAVHPIAGVLGEGLIISTSIAGKSLKDAAMAVYHPLDKGDLPAARKELSFIVGRDTDDLEEREVIRGAVETVAENTSDGITAPLFWALVGGAPLAIAYRLINTCDSMVGYKNERYEEFGWASAKLDDLVNWFPSRAAAFAMVGVNSSRYHNRILAWKITREDSRKHPSPNSGWGEAAAAAILGVSLGGTNFYKGVVSERAVMGREVIPLNRGHILEIIKLMRRTIYGFYVLLFIGGITFELAAAWIKSTLLI